MAALKKVVAAEPDSDALRKVIESISPLSASAHRKLAEITEYSRHPAGSEFVQSGRRNPQEYIVLKGLVRLFAVTSDLREVTLSFYPEGSVLTPSLARNRKGVSSVSCATLEPSILAAFPAVTFSRLMREDEEVRAFGNRVLEEELVSKTRKELALATLTAKDRLLELRRIFPGLENRAAQGHIASYLGITPISLSRLRGELTPGRRPV